MLKMLWLVVLCCKGSFVQSVLGGVSLRSGFDVHERDRRGGAPGARRPNAADTDAADTDAPALAPLTAGAPVDGTFFSPWQQLDALHASIPGTRENKQIFFFSYFSMSEFSRGGQATSHSNVYQTCESYLYYCIRISIRGRYTYTQTYIERRVRGTRYGKRCIWQSQARATFRACVR